MDIDNFLILTNPLIPSISSYIRQIEINQSNHSLPYEIILTIRHPKVVQKSYKNEKRFFCPSPSFKISGNGWRLWQRSYLTTEQLANQNNEVSNGAKSNVGMFPQCVALVDTLPEFGQGTQLKDGYASFKSLFFSDRDKRKVFRIETKIYLRPNICLGTFLSNQIRVISKPSKKKQTGAKADKINIPFSLSCNQRNGATYLQPSSSTQELNSQDPACISSGSEICIFNRGRSQAIATRYLSTNQNGAFGTSINFWDTFTIDLVDNRLSDENVEFDCKEGYITYGCYARLTSENGVTLPTLKLERIEKQKLAVPSEREPLGQLQKVAFQVVSTGQYLAFNEDRIVQVSCTSQEFDDQILPDCASLTVVTVEEATYTFHPLLFNILSPPTLIGPCPTILQVGSTFMQGKYLFLELFGSNFTPNLLVFFSTIPTLTFYRSSELIFCLVPSYKQFISGTETMEIFDIPLYLWRKDGILYQTVHKYVYCLLEHFAIDQRNEDSLHTNVTRQPDLHKEFEFNLMTSRNLFFSENQIRPGTNIISPADYGCESGTNCVAPIGTNGIYNREESTPDIHTGTNTFSGISSTNIISMLPSNYATYCQPMIPERNYQIGSNFQTGTNVFEPQVGSLTDGIDLSTPDYPTGGNVFSSPQFRTGTNLLFPPNEYGIVSNSQPETVSVPESHYRLSTECDN
ncbi:SuH [Oopsacas minuta]|uniref:SuH n=1 Tax=Oopsacas minuta TaxID=111878 RepID=A0AAV7JL55_9METZ|nr:SuH [Oopsacas minuta]